jgi:hypothetical protein
MPDPALVATYERLLEAHRRAAADLVPVLEELALATIRDVLPDAHRLQVHGEFNEDWLPTLRIHRVVGGDGTVLFDSAIGHPDERVHEVVDEVGVEYLDLLLDLTGDDYMGWHQVEA